MPQTRKSHPPSVKAKVAIEAIKGHKTEVVRVVWTKFRPFLDGGAGCPGGGPKAAIHSGLELALGIAVGMTIADHPPHRSVLAELPHTAPPLDSSVEALIGIGMKSTRARDPSIKDRPQLFPIGLPPLTTAT